MQKKNKKKTSPSFISTIGLYFRYPKAAFLVPIFFIELITSVIELQSVPFSSSVALNQQQACHDCWLS